MISAGFAELRRKAASSFDRVENGETVVVTRNGKPIAETGSETMWNLCDDAAPRSPRPGDQETASRATNGPQLQPRITHMSGALPSLPAP